MPVEFIGMIATKHGSESFRTEGPTVDPAFTRRFARADEYLGILRQTWEPDEPFDHDGRFYKFEGHYAEVRPALWGEPLAWERAERILAAIEGGGGAPPWTAPAKATGAAGNSTALVGTPETVAQSLLDYVDLGVTTILIRGYDPLDDAIDYGRHLLPLVRDEVARPDAGAVEAAGELVGGGVR
jgi:alkanesulfonate monooxygenase SsuD/methylene tetrahydromethanopterin reductase-like flavin-dependent oxidoreductase (luciferase family)